MVFVPVGAAVPVALADVLPPWECDVLLLVLVPEGEDGVGRIGVVVAAGGGMVGGAPAGGGAIGDVPVPVARGGGAGYVCSGPLRVVSVLRVGGAPGEYLDPPYWPASVEVGGPG